MRKREIRSTDIVLLSLLPWKPDAFRSLETFKSTDDVRPWSQVLHAALKIKWTITSHGAMYSVRETHISMKETTGSMSRHLTRRMICVIICIQIVVSLIGLMITANMANINSRDKHEPGLDGLQHQLHLDSRNIQNVESLGYFGQKLNRWQDNIMQLRFESPQTHPFVPENNFPVDLTVEKKEKKKMSSSYHHSFAILTTSNSLFIDLTENWLESLRRHCMQYNITLVCEDLEGYQYFSKRSNDLFHIIYTNDFVLPGRFQFIEKFDELICKRVVYIKQLLSSGRDVLLADIDGVWIKDPLPIIMDEYNKYDVWVAQGHNETIPCPCFMYMKAVPIVIKMAEQWVDRISSPNNSETDQIALMHIFEDLPNLRINRLDKVRFPSGKDFFDPDWYLRHSDQVYVAHGNHQGRHDGKKSKFQEFGYWLLKN